MLKSNIKGNRTDIQDTMDVQQIFKHSDINWKVLNIKIHGGEFLGTNT